MHTLNTFHMWTIEDYIKASAWVSDHTGMILHMQYPPESLTEQQRQ